MRDCPSSCSPIHASISGSLDHLTVLAALAGRSRGTLRRPRPLAFWAIASSLTCLPNLRAKWRHRTRVRSYG